MLTTLLCICLQIGRTSMMCAVDTAQPSQAAATQGSSAQRQTISQLFPGIQQALLLTRVSGLTFGELEPRQVFADLDLEVHIPANPTRLVVDCLHAFACRPALTRADAWRAFPVLIAVSLQQDPSGQRRLRLLFMDQPSHSALSLRPGHCVAVAGVAVPEHLAPADHPLQATWIEVLHGCWLHPMSMSDMLILMCRTQRGARTVAGGFNDDSEHLIGKAEHNMMFCRERRAHPCAT
jgi:hypothetical protein